MEAAEKAPAVPAAPTEPAFAEVVAMIQSARGRALSAVNVELVDLYSLLQAKLHDLYALTEAGTDEVGR